MLRTIKGNTLDAGDHARSSSTMKRVFAVHGRQHGNGKVKARWQKKLGNYLATSGTNNTVNIYNRKGDLHMEIPLPGQCVMMDWSKDGGILAIIHNKSTSVIFWDSQNDESVQLETEERAPLTFLQWSKVTMQLAIGTAKGNLVLYNHQTSRKIPIMGKHGNKAITSGVWDENNLLYLGGSDRTCTISNDDGVTLNQLSFEHGEPSHLSIYHGGDDVTMSLLVNRQTMFMSSSNEARQEDFVEMEFQAKYGKIVSYEWFGDRKILIGFDSGYLIIVSASTMDDLKGERYHAQFFQTRMNSVCMSKILGKFACCGDDSVIVRDLNNPDDSFGEIKLEDERGMLDQLCWSDDGQLLTITTQNGSVYTYLTKLPMLGNTYGTRVCNLTTLKEMSIYDVADLNEPRVKQTLPVEPSFLAVSQDYAAAGLNNQAWFYLVNDNGSLRALNHEREPKTYLGTVESMMLNLDYAAALCDSKVQLHLIHPEEHDEETAATRDSIMLPIETQTDVGQVTCFSLTSTFCIYATDTGGIFYFLLESFSIVNEFRHECGIRQIVSDPTGTRLVCIDEKGDTFLYNPVNDEVLLVPNVSPSSTGVLWDYAGVGDPCFVVFDDKAVETYVYKACHYKGARVEHVGSSPKPQGLAPILLNNGFLVCLTASGRTVNEPLATYSEIVKPDGISAHPKACAVQASKLGRFTEAFAAAANANDESTWQFVYDCALRSLDISMARRCAQAKGDAAASSSLASIEHEEDVKLLSGHVALMYKETDVAERLFMDSSQPIQALWLHRDLLHWDVALDLAKKLDPSQTPYISRAYAQQLEFNGSFQQALDLYQTALTGKPSDGQHDASCHAGHARMLLRTGDIRRGMALVDEINNRNVYRDCAAILQTLGQLTEAAELYAKSEVYDKAAALYIRLKNWTKVGELLANIQSSKIVLQYAKAREADGSYKDAVAAYEQAGDYESVIRINLNHLKNPEEAVRIVKHTGSTEGAKMVAQFFMGLNDPGSAIQFLVLSGSTDDAFSLAQAHSKMDTFAKYLGDNGSLTDYRSIAVYYEKNKNLLEAGRFYLKAEQYSKALELLLSSKNEDNEHIMVAIEVVGAAREERLTTQLIDYIMGDTDGVTKDGKLLFQLYTALKQFPEAARTAVIIAHEEQVAGNYRGAHDLLFQMHQTLAKEGIRIPMDIWKNLMLLHSFIMVKVHIKRQNHLKAARLLVRVANSISAFPEHLVNILTSTVIECWKAGLKNSAFNFAAMLMRQEYRGQIDPKYKAKIEKIVRKPDKSELDQDMVPSPYDPDTLVEAYNLVCPSTNNIIPFCIVSGRAMQVNDWGRMPCCQFHGLYSELEELLEQDTVCPMCGSDVNMEDVEKVEDPSSILRKFNQGTLETAESMA